MSRTRIVVASVAVFLAVFLAAFARAQDVVTSPNLRLYYPVPAVTENAVVDTDVCVYGGTSGGAIAAIQAARMGKKAVLVEFTTHIGGLTSGGLSATDGGSAAMGLAREFYQKVGRQSGFKPAEAEAAYRDMLKDAGVAVYTEHRMTGVTKDGARITEMRCENGRTFKAKMFIDATYEGDLFAAAGCSFHVGREANSVYGETIDGVQFKNAHNFGSIRVDPYVVEGDPKSGLLPCIQDVDPGQPGQGDRKIQAYNFRMQFVKGGLPFPKPRDYDAKRYELLLRYINLGGYPGISPHAGDNNNNGAFSTDHIGANWDFPDGAGKGEASFKRDEAYWKALYELREKIYQDHVSYQQGFIYFLRNDPRVPAKVRDLLVPWGLTKDSFKETGGWPHALYIREGRRLIGELVMTEANCRHKEVAADSIGLAQYTMDSHNCQRIVLKDEKTGKAYVRNEGDVQVGIPGPYPVSYRAIVPKAAECSNLLVPVSLSSSHIAFGSIRMEPVFMVLGQSAATAAAMAIDGNVPVQQVEYEKLKARLLADKQMLVWTGPMRAAGGGNNGGGAAGVKVDSLPGIVVDDADAKFTGDWSAGNTTRGFVGQGYQHDGADHATRHTATFTLPIKEAGTYDVRISYPPLGNRASNVPVTVRGFVGDAGGAGKTVKVNEKQVPPIDKLFISLGEFKFDAGATATVEISNEGADGHVIVDAVQAVPVK
jgi:hypothetical protein